MAHYLRTLAVVPLLACSCVRCVVVPKPLPSLEWKMGLLAVGSPSPRSTEAVHSCCARRANGGTQRKPRS